MDSTPAQTPVEEIKPIISESVIIDPAANIAAKAAANTNGGEIVPNGAPTKPQSWEVSVGEWPFTLIVEHLLQDLGSARWEIRHGAALGLREILSRQGAAGGKSAGCSASNNRQHHVYWTEVLARRLLELLVLDRFGDFVGDHVIAPVRETAAQALAALLEYMNLDEVNKIRTILSHMVTQRFLKTENLSFEPIAHVWEMRHSGLLSLKYLVAVKDQLFLSKQSSIDSASQEILGETVETAIIG